MSSEVEAVGEAKVIPIDGVILRVFFPESVGLKEYLHVGSKESEASDFLGGSGHMICQGFFQILKLHTGVPKEREAMTPFRGGGISSNQDRRCR